MSNLIKLGFPKPRPATLKGIQQSVRSLSSKVDTLNKKKDSKLSVTQFLQTLGMLAGVSLGLGAGAEGLRFGAKYVSAKRFDALKEPKFQAMLQRHSDLKDEKEDVVRDYFEALWQFSPSVAQNPFTAGAYIKQALAQHHAFGGPQIPLLRSLTETEKDIAQMQKDRGAGNTPLDRALEEVQSGAIKTVGLLDLGF